MGELMTIGAFARRTGLSISALRFYAGRHLLQPALVDQTNGYRRYAEDQVVDGRLIRDLRRLDMSLEQVADVLEHDPQDRPQLIEAHLRRLEAAVSRAHTLVQTMGITNPRRNTHMSATLQSLDLAGALSQVLPAAGSDPEAPHLMTVLVEGKHGSLRFVATDRHRLAIRDLVPSQLDHDFATVVSAHTLNAWRSALETPQEVGLQVGGTGLEVTGADLDLSAPVLPVTFPDYEQALSPTGGATVVQVDRRGLVEILAAGSEEREVRLSTSPGSLVVEDGSTAAPIDAQCDGPAQHATLNSRFVLDAARNAVGPELVLEIENPLRPVLFRSADDGTFTSWIMPIKVDE